MVPLTKRHAGVRKVIGLATMVVGFVFFFATNGNLLRDLGLIGSVVLGTVSFLLMGGGAAIYNAGRKAEAPSAASVSERDVRKPVLYLRSFQDDVKSAQPVMTMTAVTEEEQIAQVMNEIGPFIGIGKPGEKLPELGAARFYVGDDWQAAIKNLMAQSQLVLLRGGATEGLMWEVNTATKTVEPERLVILVPEDQRQVDRFRAQAENYLPKKLPEELGAKAHAAWQMWTHNLRGLVYFERDWTAHYVPFKPGPFGRGYREMAQVLKKAMTPVIARLGLKWKPRARLNPVFLVMVVILAIFVLFLLLLFIDIIV